MLSLEQIRHLTKGIKGGSERDFKTLHNHTYYLLYNVCKKMGISDEDAQEIVQDSFFALWQQREKIDEKYNILGLLKVITKRKVIKKLEELSLEKAYELLPEKESENNDSNISDKQKDILYILLSYLSLKQREVIEYYYLKQYPKNDISEIMGISSYTVDNHLRNAKFNLRRICKQKNIDLGLFYDF